MDAVSGSAPSPASPAVARPAARYDVGIAGAGQLARMTALAAWPLDLRVAVLGRAQEPAAGVAAGLVEGDWRDAAAVGALGAVCGVLTLENEFVDPDALAAVALAGTPVRPAPEDLAVVQDKALQKARMAEAGLAVPDFLVLRDPAEIAAAGRDLGWPMMLKARRLGYDGYGNATCATPEEAAEALARLDAGEGVLAERMVPFERELAVMVARGPGGDAVPYPVAETRQRDHVCHEVLVPAPVGGAEARAAADLALAAAEVGGGVGVTGVELFLASRAGAGQRDRAPAAQLRPLQHRGLRDLAVREPPEGRPGAAAGRGGAQGPGGRDGQPAGRARGGVGAGSARGAGRARRPRAPLRQGRGPPPAQDGPRDRARRHAGRGAGPRPGGGGGGAAVSALVGVVMGSDSDLPVVGAAAEALAELGVAHEVRVVSAHRTPLDMIEYGRTAADRGLRVIVAGAGGAAHLPGMLASVTTLPVIGIPVRTTALSGLDSLLSIVQMPRGVPVATVAVDSGRNAGLLAAQILALGDPALAERLRAAREALAEAARAADRGLPER